MSISQERLAFLFRRYYEGRASRSEVDELLAVVRASKDDTQLSELLQKAWYNLNTTDRFFSQEDSDRIVNSILNRGEGERHEDLPVVGTKPVFRVRYFAAAAAIVLICISGIWWKLSSRTTLVQTPEMTAAIEPGTDRALLTLDDGTMIQLDDLPEGMISRQGMSEVSKSEDGHLIYSEVAAKTGGGQVNTVSTPRGGQYKIRLPDGSKVWLNAASSIRFPAGFPADERRVEIEGEVFFEVAKEERRPFRIGFGASEVEVLGTSFNIAHYPGESSSMTTLVEGSILLTCDGKQNVLKPGQGAILTENRTLKIEEVDVESLIGWKNGLFYFRDADVESVMKQVSRWYDVEVRYDGFVPKKQLNGKVPRSGNLIELMEMLRYAGLNYRIDGRELVIVK